LPPFTLNHCFGKNASIGRGDGGALRGSTGREFRFDRQSQKRFRKERRKACGPALNHGKTTALWFREARRCPRAPPTAPKYLIFLGFRESDGRQGLRENRIAHSELPKIKGRLPGNYGNSEIEGWESVDGKWLSCYTSKRFVPLGTAISKAFRRTP